MQAQYSADGDTWTNTGDPTDLSGITNPQVALYATASTQAAAAEIPARFESVSITPDESDCPETCVRSDEFDASTLDPKWNVRVEDPGEYSIEDGQLVLPILNEIDGTVTGPLALASQQVPEGDWSLMTRVTPELNTSWRRIMLERGDPSATERSGSDTDTRDVGPSEPIPAGTETVWLRLYREGNTIAGEYALDDGGEPGEWVQHSGTRNVDTNPPREGEGVQLGLYAGSDIEGEPYEQTAAFDFARFEPDEVPGCSEDDVTPPVTTAQLNGAPPVPSYDGPVTATLTASDEVGGSGVESTEYRVNGGEWTAYNPLSPPMFTDPGGYSLEFRSTDVAGNVEEPPGVGRLHDHRGRRRNDAARDDGEPRSRRPRARRHV